MQGIAVIGYGTVGRGVVKMLKDNKDLIIKSVNQSYTLKRILDILGFDDGYKELFAKDFNDILNYKNISIVVKCIGGVLTFYKYVKKFLEGKKSVVTSNKELVAKHVACFLGIKIEGHADNIVPALLGGFIASSYNCEKLIYVRKEIKIEIYIYVMLPDYGVNANDSRQPLPTFVKHKDVVFNISHAVLFWVFLTEGKLQGLKEASQDRLCQSYRFKDQKLAERVVNEYYNCLYLSGLMSFSSADVRVYK